MPRSLISKSIIDALIRKKIENSVPNCESVRALPVVIANGSPGVGGSNWHVPGWVGDAEEIRLCQRVLGDYLEFLGTQFDVPNGPD